MGQLVGLAARVRSVTDVVIVVLIALTAFSWTEYRRDRLGGSYSIEATTALALDGSLVQLATWRGRVLLLNFWAPWCGPCRTEVPELVRLQDKYVADVQILGIAVSSPSESVKQFVDEHDVNYPVLSATDQSFATLPRIEALPTSLLVRRDGRIYRRYRGIPDFVALSKEIEKLIQR